MDLQLQILALSKQHLDLSQSMQKLLELLTTQKIALENLFEAQKILAIQVCMLEAQKAEENGQLN